MILKQLQLKLVHVHIHIFVVASIIICLYTLCTINYNLNCYRCPWLDCVLRGEPEYVGASCHFDSFDRSVIDRSSLLHITYRGCEYVPDASSHRNFLTSRNCQRQTDHVYSLLAREFDLDLAQSNWTRRVWIWSFSCRP